MGEFPAGSRSRTVQLGGPVRLTEYGDPANPRTILCLHGLGGSALNFALLGPLLAHEHRVLVPDLLGHGESFSPSANGGAVEAQLSMIARLLEQEAGESGVVIGHSMGGILALLHCLRRPRTVERLVMLDPPVPNVTRWARDPRLTAKLAFLHAPGVAAIVARQVAALTPEQLIDRQIADATPHVDRIPPEVIQASVDEVRESRRLDGGRAAQRAQFRAIVEIVAILARPVAWREQLAQIDAPTMWLQGVDDRLAPAADAAALAASRPEWRYVQRMGVGHLPHLEDPVWTAETISAWLADQPA